MTDQPKVHIDVFFRAMGRTYPVGHGGVDYFPDSPTKQASMVADLLHKLAWEYEEAAQLEDATKSGRPRKAITPAGDTFFEVEPDQFVVGMSLEDAMDTYQRFGGGSTFDMLKHAYPRIRWEYL